ncbi:hypothetical protein [Hansschlegelia sp.]|uniref:hypothetical protein n=1 Tax=Hansschlegelia sp. TaxID=2041892 RepID=UPI002C9EE239|nr:hypothetical protein [Hansschlegelia sp.]HVI30446.1 hypothetical protein [Hansschlegelia sp.]
MPYRIGWSPDAGTLTVVTETASEALTIIRQHEDAGRADFEIADLDGNMLTLKELEQAAAAEPSQPIS